MTGDTGPIIVNPPVADPLSSKFKYIALGVFASAVLLASHAPAAPERGDAQHVAQVHRACESAMGLPPGTAEYSACADSLRQSLADADEAASIQKDRAACAKGGLEPHTADFGLCIIERGNGLGTGR